MLLDAAEVYADSIGSISEHLAPAFDTMFSPLVQRLRHVRPKQDVYAPLRLPALRIASLALSKKTKTLEDLNDVVHRAYGAGPEVEEEAEGDGQPTGADVEMAEAGS